jgi:hypothetical protein
MDAPASLWQGPADLQPHVSHAVNNHRSARAAFVAACGALAGASGPAYAALDHLTVVVETCPVFIAGRDPPGQAASGRDPAGAQASVAGRDPPTAQAAGRDPPMASTAPPLTPPSRSCGVSIPGNLAASPAPWRALDLIAVDPTPGGGGVVATLFCMRRISGTVTQAGQVRSVRSTTPRKVTARLPAGLNFGRCGYFIRVDAAASSEALLVELRK